MTLLGASKAASTGPSWNYEKNGADWVGDDFPNCGKTNQSPINLISRESDNFEYTIYDGVEDDIKKEYSNQFDVPNKNNGHTT
jgi:hypothetical protein